MLDSIHKLALIYIASLFGIVIAGFPLQTGSFTDKVIFSVAHAELEANYVYEIALWKPFHR